jgi:hypothetical protein
LDELVSGTGDGGGMFGVDGKEVEKGKIRQRSLKSRPGAGKRREKLEKMERERFGKNMAALTVGSSANTESAPATGAVDDAGNAPGTAQQQDTNPTASRWAALRGFISQTMEQKEEFKKA